MPTKPYDIFISYRRNGGYETARHIYDLLKRDGYSDSFDQDNLMNGNFDKALLDRIAKCKDFILICDADVFRRKRKHLLDICEGLKRAIVSRNIWWANVMPTDGAWKSTKPRPNNGMKKLSVKDMNQQKKNEVSQKM
ncbi:TIR domain-containing protein [uncultured Prevotella sp.]|uniref:TIR domain-containing protein n=1 Tax=uncultured Prevotella sp. TaxID=159272 RepID=UPI0027E30321|nr:TIR domain-containing protein [uncultured Prevotella sp.]